MESEEELILRIQMEMLAGFTDELVRVLDDLDTGLLYTALAGVLVGLYKADPQYAQGLLDTIKKWT